MTTKELIQKAHILCENVIHVRTIEFVFLISGK